MTNGVERPTREAEGMNLVNEHLTGSDDYIPLDYLLVEADEEQSASETSPVNEDPVLTSLIQALERVPASDDIRVTAQLLLDFIKNLNLQGFTTSHQDVLEKVLSDIPISHSEMDNLLHAIAFLHDFLFQLLRTNQLNGNKTARVNCLVLYNLLGKPLADKQKLPEPEF